MENIFRNCLRTRSISRLMRRRVHLNCIREPVLLSRQVVSKVQLGDVKVRLYSSSKEAESENVIELDILQFEKACDETLESLTDYFEQIVEESENLKSADISYSSGVLTVNLGPKYGTYVINRQTPNRQIWLSSPTSGPKRYDFVVKDNGWIYKHDGQSLHGLLQREISKIVSLNVDFAKCSYGRL